MQIPEYTDKRLIHNSADLIVAYVRDWKGRKPSWSRARPHPLLQNDPAHRQTPHAQQPKPHRPTRARVPSSSSSQPWSRAHPIRIRMTKRSKTQTDTSYTAHLIDGHIHDAHARHHPLQIGPCHVLIPIRIHHDEGLKDTVEHLLHDFDNLLRRPPAT